MANDNITRDDKRLPDSSADPEYPYNKIYQTASGHRTEFDDTPGKERIFEGHRSGTYREISADGKLVESTVANKFVYVKGAFTMTVDQTSDIKVCGNKMVCMGGSMIEIAGDSQIVVYGDFEVIAAENAKVLAKNILLSAEQDINICAGGNLNFKIKGSISGMALGKTSFVTRSLEFIADSIDMSDEMVSEALSVV